MTYSLPFTQGQKLLEIGGANCPWIRPNLDVRKLDNVDIVADINETLPLPSNDLDGVFSKFAIEHISFRKVKAFIAELFRILKPGGTAVIVTANLLEQARTLTEATEWTDNLTEMIFGSNDYPENTHRCGGSPAYWTKLFQEVGFVKIITVPWWESKNDLVLEASKPEGIMIDRKTVYDRHYFHGGKVVGGYPNEGYRDFITNWGVFHKVMAEKPKNVIELGASRGYLLKRIQDENIPVMGMDISKHCQLTKVINDVVEYDICDTPWPFADKAFDMCISHCTLNHIPEQFIPAIAKEINRVSQRGLHGIVDYDNGFDKTVCTLKNKEWWAEKIGQKVLNKEELEELTFDCVPAGDDKLKANIGSYISMMHYGWTNIDVIDLSEYARLNQYKFFRKDILEGLPFDANSVDLIYSSHMIEHFNYAQGKAFLRECKRVMKPGAVMRLIMPDAESLIDRYKAGNMLFLDEANDGAAEIGHEIAKLWSFLFSGHQAAYDYKTIEKVAKEVGFSQCEKKLFRQGNAQILKETIDPLPHLSLFAEMVS